MKCESCDGSGEICTRCSEARPDCQCINPDYWDCGWCRGRGQVNPVPKVEAEWHMSLGIIEDHLIQNGLGWERILGEALKIAMKKPGFVRLRIERPFHGYEPCAWLEINAEGRTEGEG